MAGIAGAVRTLCMCALVLCCRGTALFPPIFDEDEPACVPSVAHQCSFVDQFKDPKSDRWIRADNYTNGEPFANYWSKGNAFVNPKFGRASMYLNKWRGPKFGKKFAGGHFLSKFWYGYGCTCLFSLVDTGHSQWRGRTDLFYPSCLRAQASRPELSPLCKQGKFCR